MVAGYIGLFSLGKFSELFTYDIWTLLFQYKNFKLKKKKKRPRPFCSVMLCVYVVCSSCKHHALTQQYPKRLSPLLIMKKNIFQKLSDFSLARSASHVYALTEREVGNGDSGIFYFYCGKWSLLAGNKDGGRMLHKVINIICYPGLLLVAS